MSPDDWEIARHLRLSALRDAPDAFARRYDDEADEPESFWRGRLTSSAVANIVALREDRELGIVVAAPYSDRAGALGLFSMWVVPAGRGQGIGDLLIDRVVALARERSFERVSLDVADDNAHALALYRRHGFEPTGRRGTLPPPREHICEQELVLEL